MVTQTNQPTTYGLDSSVARFSVAQYQRMIETGILTSDDRVELLENYVVLKMPRNPPHDGTIQLATETLMSAVPSGWTLRIQLTIELSESQPEPDFALVRGNARTYGTRHPVASDVGLVIEAANSSLLRDQRDKTRIYSQAGIPEYWILNLVDGRIEVYAQPATTPSTGSYLQTHTYQTGDSVPLTLGGQLVTSLAVDDLLL